MNLSNILCCVCGGIQVLIAHNLVQDASRREGLQLQAVTLGYACMFLQTKKRANILSRNSGSGGRVRGGGWWGTRCWLHCSRSMVQMRNTVFNTFRFHI
jgi:hypothetical protein